MKGNCLRSPWAVLRKNTLFAVKINESYDLRLKEGAQLLAFVINVFAQTHIKIFI